MIVYIPRLIESAEQAEALPVGMVATDLGARIVSAAVRTDVGLGWFVSGDEMTDMHEHLVGWTALVPIEAEEETRIDPEVFAELDARLAYTQAAYALPPGELQVRHVKRLVTPWESA